MADDKLAVTQKNLTLLRQQYLKLNDDYNNLKAQVEQNQLSSPVSSDNVLSSSNQNRYIFDILFGIQSLYKNGTWSDISIQFSDDKKINAHKFVLTSRSKLFAEMNLKDCSVYSFEKDITYEMASAFIRFLYNDNTDLPNDDKFLLQLMLLANDHSLPKLVSMCELKLIGLINPRNCTVLFKYSTQLRIDELRSASLNTILNEFDNLKEQDFVLLDSELLVEIYQSKTMYPLHLAIEHGRDDVVFLLLLSDEKKKLNTKDKQQRTPLKIALDFHRFRIAESLVEHHCDINAPDMNERTLLHLAINGEDIESVKFLLTNSASVNAVDNKFETPLHYAIRKGNYDIVTLLLEHNGNVNAQNNQGQAPLHLAIELKLYNLVDLLVQRDGINLNILDKQFSSPLWIALQSQMEDIANILFEKGCDMKVVDSEGNSLLHRAINNKDLFSAKFIINKGVYLNIQNKIKQTPLHRASLQGLKEVVHALLENEETNPNAKDAQGRTSLHLAIQSKNPEILNTLLTSGNIDVNVIDNNGVSPLWESIITSQQETIGSILIERNANVNSTNLEGNTLLYSAIVESYEDGAIYLLNKNAHIERIDTEGRSCLEVAIAHDKSRIIQEVCRSRGVSPNKTLSKGMLPLELAFELKFETSCQALVECGADVNIKVAEGPLLARVISKGDEFAAVFLIKSGAQVNISTPTNSPLHAAAEVGLKEITTALLQKGADPNWKNEKSQTPLHLAVLSNQYEIVEILLANGKTDVTIQDQNKKTVYQLCFELRNERMAEILAKFRNYFSNEVDSNGMTMLYSSIGKENGKKDGDEEAVKFLLKLNVKLTEFGGQSECPLHLAIRLGRVKMCSLLLDHDLGAVNCCNTVGQTPLHIASMTCDINTTTLLVKYGAKIILDHQGNTALHLALQNKDKVKKKQASDVAKLLVSNKPGFLEVQNHKGQLPIHVLAEFGGDPHLVDILLSDTMDINQRDNDGNTPMLTGFLHTNSEICVELMKRGAALWMTNNEKVSVLDEIIEEVNLMNPGRLDLQRKLLEMITSEPPWIESPCCQLCSIKFNVKIRKHHCRHCGRIGCSACLPKNRKYPIIKFNLHKPERLCSPCYDVLSNPSAIQNF